MRVFLFYHKRRETMAQKLTSGKSRSPVRGHNVAKQAKSGRKYDLSYPDVPIPEVKKYGDKGLPSLLETAFGVKVRTK